MPKKQNYGFDKRKKEQDRKAKKDAKIAERRLRNAERSSQEQADGTQTDGAQADVTPEGDTPPAGE